MSSAARATTLRQFLQLDRREGLSRIGTEPWITVYSYGTSGVSRRGFFCALIPSERLEAAMSRASWDLSIGDGEPGFTESYPSSGEPVTRYHRFVTDHGIEPLVFKRHFHGIKPETIELLEEFRHFHHLYHDQHNGRYIRILDSGEEEIVAEVTVNSVRIRTRAIRQFLAVKNMHLLVFFDDVVEADVNVEDIPPAERVVDDATASVRFSFHAANGSATTSGLPISRLLGKVAVPPLPLEQCGIWPYDETKREYADFVIGLDEHGNPVRHTCDPEQLANYFGRNPDAPNFLTPVVFRREVLKKYYEHPEKYEVEDGYLRCGSLWGLRMDNDAPDRVTVFLGDLGETLEYEEQLYWRSFNKTPEGGRGDLSETNIRRSFLGEFAEPTSPELIFKRELTELAEAWEKRFGWPLIRPMSADDAHVLKKLHAPTTSSVAEFEDQLLLLTKVLVDSLNDTKIVETLGSKIPDEKSIGKLERFLTGEGYPDTRRDIEFLRLLQEARSGGAAHRKGDGYKKIARKLGLESRSTQEVFTELLQNAIAMLHGLKGFFLSDT
ncbi:MAG TPA: hypothetical protein VHC69_02155 [Polyangiaceae bacterium]|nr:hypothetical protein [Polyangiaceae bacterium]